MTIPHIPEVPDGYYTLSGYRPAGERAIRIDMLERLADLLRAQDTRGGFEANPDMLSITGMTLEQFAGLMQGLGYSAEKGERPKVKAAAPVQPEAPAPEASDAPLTEEESVLAAETRAKWEAEQAEKRRAAAAEEGETDKEPLPQPRPRCFTPSVGHPDRATTVARRVMDRGARAVSAAMRGRPMRALTSRRAKAASQEARVVRARAASRRSNRPRPFPLDPRKRPILTAPSRFLRRSRPRSERDGRNPAAGQMAVLRAVFQIARSCGRADRTGWHSPERAALPQAGTRDSSR